LKQSVSIRQYPAGHRDSVVSTLCAAAAEEPTITPMMANKVRKLVRMFLTPAHEVLNARINIGPALPYLSVNRAYRDEARQEGRNSRHQEC
jgi:hypothetical protein